MANPVSMRNPLRALRASKAGIGAFMPEPHSGRRWL